MYPQQFPQFCLKGYVFTGVVGCEGNGSMTTPPGGSSIVGVTIIVDLAAVVSTVFVSTVVVSTCREFSFKVFEVLLVLDSNISVSFNCFTGDVALVQTSLFGWVGTFSVILPLVDSSEI